MWTDLTVIEADIFRQTVTAHKDDGPSHLSNVSIRVWQVNVGIPLMYRFLTFSLDLFGN